MALCQITQRIPRDVGCNPTETRIIQISYEIFGQNQCWNQTVCHTFHCTHSAVTMHKYANMHKYKYACHCVTLALVKSTETHCHIRTDFH